MVYLSRPWTPVFNPYYIGPYPSCSACPCNIDLYKRYKGSGHWESRCYHSY
ncbi:uncharacterized protein LOC108095097 [Drosophila ficusphila]|uniref:uncharacterized protein LOC108095097 n=1 Tax=Drosophila ficusphila TaxID=30025 RepID=UPI0007E68661|nr:uncharacterized protein LOC108095097 [Drosophila ficusphila]